MPTYEQGQHIRIREDCRRYALQLDFCEIYSIWEISDTELTLYGMNWGSRAVISKDLATRVCQRQLHPQDPWVNLDGPVRPADADVGGTTSERLIDTGNLHTQFAVGDLIEYSFPTFSSPKICEVTAVSHLFMTLVCDSDEFNMLANNLRIHCRHLTQEEGEQYLADHPQLDRGLVKVGWIYRLRKHIAIPAQLTNRYTSSFDYKLLYLYIGGTVRLQKVGSNCDYGVLCASWFIDYFELKMTDPDGKTVWIPLAGIPKPAEQGKVVIERPRRQLL